MGRKIWLVSLAIILAASAVVAQTGGKTASPARSPDETVALGYIHTVVYAQKDYKKKHGNYATSLAELVHSGSFTKRMASTDRGAYTVHFHGKPTEYALELTPKQFDPEHRAFFVNETGKVHVEEDKPATPESPLLK